MAASVLKQDPNTKRFKRTLMQRTPIFFNFFEDFKISDFADGV